MSTNHGRSRGHAFPALPALRMSCLSRIILAGLLLVSAAGTSFAEDPPDHLGSASDYRRLDQLPQQTRDKVFRDKIQPQWFGDRGRFWYRVAIGPGQHEFILVDPAIPLKEPAFDHGDLARQLSAIENAQYRPDQLPLESLVFEEAPNAVPAVVFFKTAVRTYRYHRGDQTLDPIAADQIPKSAPRQLTRPQPSPGQGAAGNLTIINQRDQPVGITWFDRRGRPKSYGQVAPGAESDFATFVGHVWGISDSDERPLMYLESTGENRFVVEPGISPLRIARRRPAPSSTSPDGQWRATILDSNVVLKPLGPAAGKQDDPDHTESRLTTDGTKDYPYDSRFYWSPNSEQLVVTRTRPGQKRVVQMIESSPSDQIQPRLVTHVYDKPGDQLDVTKPFLFHIPTRRQVSLSDQLFDNPFSIREIRWSGDSREFSFVYNQRGHQALRVVGVEASSGKTRAIVDEVTNTFIDYAGKYFYRSLPERGELIWMSERDGWNHLYLIDYASGEIKRQITRGDWVVRSVDRIDEATQKIFFVASGIDPQQDPYHQLHCHVNFDGSGLTIMTPADGDHSIEYSPDGSLLLDTYSRVDAPPTTELRRVDDGSLVLNLETADISRLLQTGWRCSERMVAKGRDGITDIHGVVHLPMNFDPNRRYPVVEYIYAGPQDSFVPKRFFIMRQEKGLAELGFIVVQIDGMGTSNRSKAFHDVCWKNLGDSGFPDRIAWLKAAAKQYPQMDLSRVGIYGGSAGGQSALRGLLAHGEMYDVGVADCGCHDNRMDKVWWNELWMGWPVGDHYASQSNVTNAHRLTGKLLLIVGELDRNVDPASTMQVVDALIKADKDFDLLVVPGAGHGIGSGKYGMRRTRDFLVRHLIGQEPRHDSLSN